jgi:hypothetical protein
MEQGSIRVLTVDDRRLLRDGIATICGGMCRPLFSRPPTVVQFWI